MMKTTLPLVVKKYRAIVILSGIFFCSFDQVKAQNVPQLTGWTFSRSFGNGMQKTSSAFSKSEAEIKGSVSGVNVIPLTSSGPDSSFLVVDPEKPYIKEHPYNNKPDDKALKTKYFKPASEDFN